MLSKESDMESYVTKRCSFGVYPYDLSGCALTINTLAFLCEY